MNGNLKKRKGFISFSDNPIGWLEKDVLKEIFSRFFPTHLEIMNIKYYGYSEYFEEVEDESVTNEYVAVIKTDKIGCFESIKFTKQ